MKRKIRMGMVGGGPGAFIGNVHRMASRLDGLIDLVCGAFDVDPEKSKAMGRSLFLPESRCYATYDEMFEAEMKLPEGERMDFVSITTPNHLHAPIALKALKCGFHVVCEKPMTLTVEDAEALAAEVEKTGLIFCLTHNYTAYPMSRVAKRMVRNGDLGEIRRIMVEYPQGWLADVVKPDNMQGSWRTNPKTSGVSCCMGDIGSHSENLAEFISGLKITELCANIKSFVPGRTLDDDGDVLLKFDNGAIGSLTASQIAVGEENALKIRIYGTKAAIEWNQQDAETLIVKYNDRPMQVMRRNWAGIGAEWSRVPAGHPEGFLEAFGNIYRDLAMAINARLEGVPYESEFPTVHDGLRGVRFIHAVVASKGNWVKL
ncbi:MAG: Gfo/Idh/MocA family oxidoreductase [Lentisphaerae bacterium]|nr:Gfo/Idh/MocA family oxidoreductase [Lentisphaerota bacterium]